MAFFQSLAQFKLGLRNFIQQSYITWFVLFGIVNLILIIILLKYFHNKKYRFTFTTGFIAGIAFICHIALVSYAIMTGELHRYSDVTYFAYLGTSMLYALSLVFSDAGKRPWLKTAGAFGFIIDLGLLSLMIWSMNLIDVQMINTVQEFNKWSALASPILPILYIMNFSSELRQLQEDNKISILSKSPVALVFFVGLISVVAILYSGQKVTSESPEKSVDVKKVTPREERLAEPFESRSYVSSQGDTLLYRFLKPLDHDPEKKYPLVVSLHHAGAPGTDNIRQVAGSEFAVKLSKQVNRKKYPAFLFVPQCPPGSNWNGVLRGPKVDLLVFETISAIEEEFAIDESRRYVTGLSMGGHGAWHFICTRPNMFAAAIPVCGGGDPDLAKKIIDVKVWAFHGRKDKTVPVRFSRGMIKAIKKAGGDPLYTEFPDGPHNIWSDINHTPGLLDWLFDQKRY
ncbi:MAG: peptidase [Cyclobacteriaceae bacterium]|nr:peptidase [Cyclobacteriaceae bacterium]